MLPVSILLLALLLSFAAGCSHPGFQKEPTDDQLREALERHRDALDELRQMFEDDAAHELFEVIVDGAYGSRCMNERVGVSCLAIERWRDYAERLRATGVIGIRGDDRPRRFYFVFYKGPSSPGQHWHRGLVYARGPIVPKFVGFDGDLEDRIDLGHGWYSYLFVDN
jgi:hypothetical protein